MDIKANGKLLLTGEYLILEGAKSIALPLQLGQSLEMKMSAGSELMWKALDADKSEWFSAKIDLFNFDIEKTSDQTKADFLRKIIKKAASMNSDFLSQWKKYKITTKLDFYKDWGLGTSSTLVFLIAMIAEIDPFELYFRLFDGSAYDIACAYAQAPIKYQLTKESIELEEVNFKPKFRDHLFFVYSGRKQDSQVAVQEFKASYKPTKKNEVALITEISEGILEATTLQEFNKLINSHEEIMSQILKKPKLKDQLFPENNVTVKSLGAWGGDFFLYSSEEDPSETPNRLKKKGFDTFFQFDDIVLQ